MTNLEASEMLQAIDKSNRYLTPWQKDFVVSLIEGKTRSYSERQKEIIGQIYRECGSPAAVVFKHKTEKKPTELPTDDLELAQFWCDRWAAKQADIRHPTPDDKTERKVIRAMRNLFDELIRLRKEKDR